MTRPLTMSGELEGKKRGQALKSSLRQSILPLAASRQVTTPRTPTVTTLPCATAGELRGPEKLWAAPEAPRDWYLSRQISLPSAAFRQRVISYPSWRVKTYSRSPTRAGVETPSPTGMRHFFASSLGHCAGALKPVALASRLAPRH